MQMPYACHIMIDPRAMQETSRWDKFQSALLILMQVYAGVMGIAWLLFVVKDL